MSKAVTCPVCNGTGKYKETYNYSLCVYAEHTCYGCNGKGWVEVKEES